MQTFKKHLRTYQAKNNQNKVNNKKDDCNKKNNSH